MCPASQGRWLDRILGALAGACAVGCVGLAWNCISISPVDGDERAPQPRGTASRVVETSPERSSDMVSVDRAYPADQEIPDSIPVRGGDVGPPFDPARLETPTVEVEVEVPVVRLAQLPGTRAIHNDAQRKGKSWVVVQAYAVPASLVLVRDFYRKAVQEADLQLRNEDPPAPAGSGGARDKVLSAIVRARNDSVDVHISLKQTSVRLQTRVRVIWREWD